MADNRLPGLAWMAMTTVESGSERMHPGIVDFAKVESDLEEEAALLGRVIAAAQFGRSELRDAIA